MDEAANELRTLRGVSTDLSTAQENVMRNLRIPLVESSGTAYRTYKKQKHFYLPVIRPGAHPSEVDRIIIETIRPQSLAQFPLLIQGKTIGILMIAFGSGRRTRADMESLARFCDQMAGAVYGSNLLREVQASRVHADSARAESERLLQNILPARVAEELKRTGRVDPLFYDSVTVLFTDFVGFTQASERMLPDELIEELDGFFSQFDEVVKRNKMEKLKTIGDSYMCAAGLPDIVYTHAVDACLAALELRAFMQKISEIKEALGQKSWRLRIGIHSGPVTAGVVGTNKFAYDIWGDTVNTASRMESVGEAEKINISGATYDLVKDFFDCEYRGKVEAKGKGSVDMHFLLRIKPGLCIDPAGFVPNGRFELLRAQLVPAM